MSAQAESGFLSTAGREAIKTALAVTIAMGIALYMNWEKPYWAGFAVAFISLGTQGQSLNKGAMRMFGTLVAIGAALTFLAWFPQDRWALMALTSIYVGSCAYMMTGERHQYFWYASGFIAMVMVADSHDSLSSFQIAVERAQETGTGVLVYSLISGLLWPVGAKGAFEEASRALFTAQVRLYQAYCGLMHGEGRPEDFRAQRNNALQLLKRVEQLRNAAESDSYTVWEVRHQWRRFHAQSTALMETLGHWRTSLPEVKSLDLALLVPNLGELESELDQRFAQIERMLHAQAPERTPRPVTLQVGEAAMRELSPFQVAAVETSMGHIHRLEALTLSMFDCVRELRGYPGTSAKPLLDEIPPRMAAIDVDRLQGAVTVLAIYWISFLMWVYVDTLPGQASFWQMSTLFAMLCVMTGTKPLTGLAVPSILGTVIGGLLYVFVMPHLSGYGQLGLLLFALVFAFAYRFSEPYQVGLKAAFIANAVSTMSIRNEQSYSFVAFANSLTMIILVSALLVAVFYLPPSPRPEKTFVRLYRRFFRHAEHLSFGHARYGWGHQGIAKRWQATIYGRDLLALPDKLAACAQKIDYAAFPANTPEKVQTLVSSLYDLAFRLRDLIEARGSTKERRVEERLLDELDAWHQVLVARLQSRAGEQAPTGPSSADLRERLAGRLASLEAAIEATFSREAEGTMSSAERRDLFRLLGSYRGLSEAEIDTARLAEQINWAQWQESRF